MLERFKQLGISNKLIERGQIYRIPDDVIQYPKSRLPNQPARNYHETRLVLIVQSDEDNEDVTYRTVLVTPTSSRTDLKDNRSYELAVGQGGVKKPCIVELGLLQPILKIDLIGKPLGKLDAVTMSEIDSIIASNLGLIEHNNQPP